MIPKQRILVLPVFFLSLACSLVQFLGPTSAFTPTTAPASIFIPATPSSTLSPTEIPVDTPTPTLSAIEKIVDGYLTAIEHDNWQVAYDYLCPEIQALILTPDDMYRRILIEIGSIPDNHTFLPAPDRPNRVLFILSRTDGWFTGIREARLQESSLKICGVGPKHGDLRYLLQPDNIEPLNIDP